MALDRIRLHRFRNHAATAIDGTGGFNLLIGENGAGKTNVLEAISLFAPGRGLRRAALADMAQAGSDLEGGGFAVSAELGGPALNNPADPLRLGTGSDADRPTRRLVQINGAERGAAALGEWLSLSWLTPAMDRLFVEAPSGRRRFLDRLVLAVEPGHARHTARAEAALRERNRLLSDPAPLDAAWLDAIEAQFAQAAALVAQARARLIGGLMAALAQVPSAPFARPDLTYRPGGPIEVEPLLAALAANRPLDRAGGRSLIGPQRDDFDAHMAGSATAAALTSTGEQKAMLIAIILAHGSLGGTERARLLLLDEIAAHLDPLRRAALFERLAAGSAQVWMTGTEATPFAAIHDTAAIWLVAAGNVSRAD